MAGARTRAVALLLLGLAATGLAADTLHVIDLRHRPAAEIQPLIQPLLRPNEGISGSGYQLFLRANAARRDEIARVIASLDVALRQLTITVRQTALHEERQTRDAVSGEVDIGGRGHVILPDDGADGNASAGARGLRYRFERRSSQDNDVHTQVLRVQDGGRAFVRVGQSVPVVEHVLALTGRRAAVLATGVRFEELSTGFELRLRVRGDTVQLEIAPRLSAPGRNDGAFQFHELRTTVTARLGEWIDLGALTGQSSKVHRAILQSARDDTRERITVLLKVE